MTIKAYDKTIENKTIVDSPNAEERRRPGAYPLLLSVAAASQSITPWGVDFKRRDQELRSFWVGESWLASVVYSVSIRNASFAWEVIGSDPTKPTPKNTIKKVTQLLKHSDRGGGWRNLINKSCIDLYTQDNACWWEIIRLKNRPDSPVINIAHLDSARVQRTGDPEYPAIYTDRYGKERLLRYWQVRSIEEFPSPYEDAFNMQYSAVTRALLAAEIIESISVYKQEKVSGAFTKAVDLVSGVSENQIEDALTIAQEQILNRSQYRFAMPVIVPGIDPSSSLSHVHIDLASLPDNFNEDTSFKWYVAQLAAAFGVDYQEIAPLMTGNLGSSQQSEIMHLKTRGKGPALIMGLIEDIINDGLVPANVKFQFKEQDLRSETEKANARFTRSKDRAMRLKSGELDPKAARVLAVEDGDLPEWLAKEIDARGDTQQESTAEENAELSANQVMGGIDSQETKAFDANLLRKMISTDPLLTLKAEYGLASGTVIARVAGIDAIKAIQSKLVDEYRKINSARFTPEEYLHVTLVHCPLVEDTDFKNIHNNVTNNINGLFPISFSASRVDYFDVPGGYAAVLLVDESEELFVLHKTILDEFTRRDIAVSEFSEQWKPHITLGYLSQDAIPKRMSGERVTGAIDAVEFTRSDYRTEYYVYKDIQPRAL